MKEINDFNNKKEEFLNIESKVNLVNIKSVFILKKIFESLNKMKALSIIKHNKATQKRLNISENDYKNYSKIEIEIIPSYISSDRFIKIKKGEESYFHIYLDDNKEETKKPYLPSDSKVNKIRIIIDYQVKSFSYLFNYCDNIESINFIKFHRNNITDMSYMFYKCRSLKVLNLSNFNTNNVTDMSNMFFKCKSLRALNLSNFNTINVTNMKNMFYKCKALKRLDLSNFNTTNVINMSYMFYKCKTLKELNLSNFNSNNVNNMCFMFYRCRLLKELNISNFRINNNISVRSMFHGCSREVIDKIEESYPYINDNAFIN